MRGTRDEMHDDDDRAAGPQPSAVAGPHSKLDLTFGLPVSQPVALRTIRLGSRLIVEFRPILQARSRPVSPHQWTQLHGIRESVLSVAEVQFVLGQSATSTAYALSGCSTCQFYCAVKALLVRQ